MEFLSDISANKKPIVYIVPIGNGKFILANMKFNKILIKKYIRSIWSFNKKFLNYKKYGILFQSPHHMNG